MTIVLKLRVCKTCEFKSKEYPSIYSCPQCGSGDFDEIESHPLTSKNIHPVIKQSFMDTYFHFSNKNN